MRTRLILQIIYGILIAAQLFDLFRVKKEDGAIGRKIRHILATTAGIIFSFAVASMCRDKYLSLFMYGVYLSLSSWLIVGLMAFSEEYTRVFYGIKGVKIGVYAFGALDTILLLTNVFHGKLFDVEKIDLYRSLESEAASFNILVRIPGFFTAHVVVWGIFTLLIFTSLIAAYIKSPDIYKNRYLFVAISVFLLCATDGINVFTHRGYGFSLLAYGLLGLFLFYYTLRFVKKELMGSLLSSSIKDMGSALMVFDIDDKCIYSNDMAQEFFDLKNNDSETLRKWMTGWSKHRPFSSIEDFSWTETHENRGEKHHFESTYTRLFDKKNKFMGFVLSVTDRTRDVNKFKAEQFKASHDPLTKLYNREGFEAKVREIISSDPEVPRVIVCCDIKNFKLINDLFGQKQADGLLVNIASILSAQCSHSDSIPARLEGDRFALCIRKDRYSDSMFEKVAQESVHIPGNKFYKVICYIGVYDIVDNTLPVATMCDRAQMAIDTIKGDYNKIIAHYDGGVRENSRREQEIISELNHAIEDDQFQIYLQPQVDGDRKTVGAEALARWIHPKKGMVQPKTFIPIFERTGLITVLDMHIWEKACQLLQKWKEANVTDLSISVNISPRDFLYVDVYKVFTELVEKYEIPVKNLKLEITEGAIMNDPEKQIALIKRLQGYGFVVEMDDFGSGYSSLNTLKDITVDVLKLDMAFLGKSENAGRGKDILKSIIELAKSLNMLTISEGVETEEQEAMLKKLGSDQFQGYLYSKPIPVEEFEDKYLTLPEDNDDALNELLEGAGEEEAAEETAENAE